MGYSYDDAFVRQLVDDVAALVTETTEDQGARRARVRAKLRELALVNSPHVGAYWSRIGAEVGVPDSAFRGDSTYWFPESPPARIFHTSGTTGSARGTAAYSASGLELMRLSILRSAERFALVGLERPIVVRLIPDEAEAPHTIMAYGMAQIARELGHPEVGAAVIRQGAIDFERLARALDAAVALKHPVVLIGGSFGIVNVCDALEKSGKRWQLPEGSRLVDAGGFKGRSRVVRTDDMRLLVERTFGIPRGAATNIFGMTELASQLYDSKDVAVGPLGERPKAGTDYVWPLLRDPRTLEARSDVGLVEVVDLCIIDRPHAVLTGDLGVAGADGVAIVGRAERRSLRGCSLALEQLST